MPVKFREQCNVPNGVESETQPHSVPETINANFHDDTEKVCASLPNQEVVDNRKQLYCVLLPQSFYYRLEFNLNSVNYVQKAKDFEVLVCEVLYFGVRNNRIDENVAEIVDDNGQNEHSDKANGKRYMN